MNKALGIYSFLKSSAIHIFTEKFHYSFQILSDPESTYYVPCFGYPHNPRYYSFLFMLFLSEFKALYLGTIGVGN